MIDINYYNLDEHQLTVALTVMDENWLVVMRSTDLELVAQYVYERSRCQEEIQHRASIERSHERASKVWARRWYDLDNARYKDAE